MQLAVAAAGFAAVVALAAHGHDAKSLVGGATAHTALETGLMIAAMMLPVAALTVPLVMQRSLPSRRLVAVGEHAVGFGLVWFTFGVAVAIAFGAVSGNGGLLVPFAIVATAAAGWQVSRRRSIIVRRCGRLRCSPPRGPRSDIGVAVAGADQAVWCLRTCSLSMTAMVLAPHPAVMGLLWAANLSEWAPGPNPFGRSRRIRPAIALGLLAVGAMTVAALR
jgi:hypothetical protein